MPPKDNFEKIKYSTDGRTFEKAVDVYKSGKITQFHEEGGTYSALVQGSKPYWVLVEA